MTVPPAILRYAAGELSAERAAGLLGIGVSASEVIVMAKAAGFPPPEPPLAQQRAELAHAYRVLGLLQPVDAEIDRVEPDAAPDRLER